jgi:crossover junction endodeoxyribonuclease RusA
VQQVEIRVPWPASELSPNRRAHWSQGYKAKRTYRTQCCVEAEAQVSWDQVLPDALHLHLVFHRPSRRHYDIDNLIARMKAGIDGVCDALHIDDKRFKSQSAELVDMNEESRQSGGIVLLQIRGHA